MDTHTEDDIQVIVQVSETERIAKLQNHDGSIILSHQYRNSEGHWRACCPPVPLSVYTNERAIFVLQRCPHYGKRDGHEVILPSLRRHAAPAG